MTGTRRKKSMKFISHLWDYKLTKLLLLATIFIKWKFPPGISLIPLHLLRLVNKLRFRITQKKKYIKATQAHLFNLPGLPGVVRRVPGLRLELLRRKNPRLLYSRYNSSIAVSIMFNILLTHWSRSIKRKPQWGSLVSDEVTFDALLFLWSLYFRGGIKGANESESRVVPAQNGLQYD